MLNVIRNRLRSVIRSAQGVWDAALSANADVVSVDLFDTLVFRRVLEPTSVFYLQHGACADVLRECSPSEWSRRRKHAEEMLAKAVWPEEVQLSHVYDRLMAEMGLSAESRQQLFDVELAVEMDVIRPFTDMVDVLTKLSSGRTIVVTTDTYLPEHFIRRLLDRFLGFEYTLLCSSALGATKRSGAMFARLREIFSGRKIVHFGDNPHSDLAMARKGGIDAFQVAWQRQAVLTGHKVGSYARSLGIVTLLTPWDGLTNPSVSPVEQVAWRWSFVLADFLFSVRDYADRVGATDIWFLSRDSETMFKSLSDAPGFLGERTCRYVYGSRACVYPVIARSDPALYEKWRGHAPTESTKRDGDVARAYYGSLISRETSRVLIVDIGWNGRLQILFDRIVPEDVDVFGFYFSLEPAAVPAIQTLSGTFVDWNPAVFNQAMVEALSGYAESSAIKLVACEHGFEPIFRDGPGDRSPIEYCERLRIFLTGLLSGKRPGASVEGEPHLELRKAIVREMSLYPDQTMIQGFAEWSIGTLIDGSDTVNIANGGQASWWQKLAGRSDAGNVWPSAAIWTLTGNRHVGRLLQHGIRSLFEAKYLVEGRSYAKVTSHVPKDGQLAGTSDRGETSMSAETGS